MPSVSRPALPSLTVVSPFFNEEAGLQRFYEVLTDQLDELGLPYDMVFVDDGSQDDTLRLLHAIADSDPRVTVLALSRNFGHQVALPAGLDHAHGDVVVVMDSDLQHPPHVIVEMLALYRERNLVERFFGRIKHFRAVATRYDKRASTYLATVLLASIVMSL
ncbi:MAG: glycosyltransferase [Anaerolineae bacterium]